MAVMEAGQDLWTMWSLRDWAQEIPYYKFFSVAMVPGWQLVALANINMGDTQEMPLFKEDNKDFVTLPVQKPYASLKSLGKRKAGEILGAGILGEPKLEERDDGAPVALEGSEESRESESAKLVWRPTNEPATKFKQVTCRVGELQEMEASMADYANACKRWSIGNTPGLSLTTEHRQHSWPWPHDRALKSYPKSYKAAFCEVSEASLSRYNKVSENGALFDAYSQVFGRLSIHPVP
ncbi:hypothetical protein C0991_003796 [Blastosporella zonata]|nr:hypothetical protein C0991_003796 [Blastosporella zonata]